MTTTVLDQPGAQDYSAFHFTQAVFPPAAPNDGDVSIWSVGFADPQEPYNGIVEGLGIIKSHV